MKLGAHLSISGGFGKALEKLVDIGGNCLQIFSSSPRGWDLPKTQSKEQIKNFLDLKKKLKIDPVYFHATYLINLADSGRIGDLSKKMLIVELNLAAELGIRGSVVHLGSFKNKDTTELRSAVVKSGDVLLRNIKEILAETPQKTFLMIENAGNHKIGANLEEMSGIIKEVQDERVRICLDTCHLHAVGYDLSTKEKLDGFLGKLGQLGLLDKLELIHANDSRDSLGSFRDRHENLGQGLVGEPVFKLLLNHAKTKDLPFIIETPGFDLNGPDQKNLEILKSWCQD